MKISHNLPNWVIWILSWTTIGGGEELLARTFVTVSCMCARYQKYRRDAWHVVEIRNCVD
jgi:hypothetical protein